MPYGKVTRRDWLGGAAASGLAGLASPALAGREADRQAALDGFALNTECWWTDLPFEERFERAARLGFTRVEYWSVKPPGRDAAKLARLCRDLGLTVAQVSASPQRIADPATPLATFLDEMKRSLDQGKAAGAPMMTVVGAEVIPGLSVADLLARYRDRLAAAVPLAQAAGITMMIEPWNPYNHPGCFLYGSQDAVRLCREVGSPALKINWDLFHMQRAEGNLVDAFRRGKDQAVYLQIADSPDRHQPGTGEVRWDWVLREIRRAGFTGLTGLELWPTKGDEARVADELIALASAIRA